MKAIFNFLLLLLMHTISASSNEVVMYPYKLCNQDLGYCVPSTLCSNQTVFSDGSGIINSRFTLDDIEENGECHYLETCCDPESIISKEDSQTRIENIVNEDTTQQCVQQCKIIDEPFSKKLPLRIHSVTHQPIGGCGHRNKHGIGLQLTQDPSVAQFGEFPWHLALKERKNSKFVYICGASLIHPQVALTSAHCVYAKESTNLRIRAGEWDTQTINEPFSHSDHNVLQIVINPEFNSANMFNDVALVVLESLVTLSAHINTICLPPYNFKFNDQICFASGWGRENFHNESAYRVNLKKMKLPVVPLRTCQERLRQTKLGDKFKLSTSFLCAGGEKNVDTCVGDGGSALVCGIPGQTDYYYQAGTVSWGVECGHEGVPGVYSNLAKFREWIDDEMRNLDFGTETYTF